MSAEVKRTNERVALAERRAAGGTLSPGTPFGRYRINSLVGRGGSGAVYRALDVRLQRDIALKMLDCSPSFSVAGRSTRPASPRRSTIPVSALPMMLAMKMGWGNSRC